MKKFLSIFITITTISFLLSSCGNPEKKKVPKAKAISEYDVVAFNDHNIKLEYGDEIRQNYWNDTRKAAYLHKDKETTSSKKISLLDNLQIGSNIADVIKQYKIKPGYAVVNREIDTCGDGTTKIVQQNYSNLNFYNKEKVLDAMFCFGFEWSDNQWIPLRSKTITSLMKNENTCKKDTILFYYDTVGSQLTDETNIKEKCIISIRVTKLKRK